jgi:hypothetical protein
VAVLVSACAKGPDGPPRDCATAQAQFWDCAKPFEKHADGVLSIDFQAMAYACIPLAEPKEYSGSWATDFEWSRFYEGRQPTPSEVFDGYEEPEPFFNKGVKPPPASTDKASLWAVKFIGREDSCRILGVGKPPMTIFVERMINQKLVWEVQGYPTYTYEPSAP